MIGRGLLLFSLCVCSGMGLKGWEPCGTPPGCFCKAPILSEIQCLDLDRMPVFDDITTPGVLSFTFLRGSISEVTPFENTTWDRLKYLNIIDTDNLPCSAIAELQRPGLHILSECIIVQCPGAEESNKTVSNTCHTSEVAYGEAFVYVVVFLNSMVAVCILVIAGVISYYSYKRIQHSPASAGA